MDTNRAGLRRRLNVGEAPDSSVKENSPEEKHKNENLIGVNSGTFWLTRIVILRYIAFIYFIAFLVAWNQNGALIGKRGLLPADLHLDHIHNRSNGEILQKLQYAPTIIWFFNYRDNIDTLLHGISFIGLVLSGFVVIMGSSNVIIMLLLWVLYHSIVNVGQRWYSFGWESQLLETGFLAAFLCPLINLRQLQSGTPPPFAILFCFRWLIFRIMMGAGLIKIRGDKCWLDLTCMNYHYETQPVPNPLSYFMHQEPEFLHKFETSVNHFIELLAPILLLLPRKLCMFGGFFQIIFQIVLIISGNLSFLNWLTITPSLACFDDKAYSWFFSKSKRSAIKDLEDQSNMTQSNPRLGHYIRKVFNVCFIMMIAYLSVPIVQNLFSSRQIMNTSFEPLRIVNTYGAFGSITKKRTEVIFQGSYHDDPFDSNATWLEYEFKCKPGSVSRRPCLISPYHYRLDWLMWFAAFQNYQHNNWLVHLGIKFLLNSNEATSLISYNPFQDGQPPKWVRAEHYSYKYTKIGSKESKKGNWWIRKRIGSYLPPISLETIKDYAKLMQWPLITS